MDDGKEVSRLLFAFIMSSIAGVAVGVMRGIIQEKHGDWSGMVRGVLASILVAVLVGFSIDNLGLSVTLKSAIIGVSAFVADDVLLALLAMGRVLGRDPFGFIARVLSAYRGQLKADELAELGKKAKRGKRDDAN
ncbi:MAG: hypothetical protein ACTHKB_15785 [Burkholderiaceae bacterium]